MVSSISEERYMKKVREKFNDRFVVRGFTSLSEDLTVICAKHGVQKENAAAFLRRNEGCYSCGIDRKSENKRLTDLEILTKAHEVHGDKYGYLIPVRDPQDSKYMFIRCGDHGLIRVPVLGHLSGNNCELCTLAERGKSRRIAFEEFLQRARKVHGDLYEYDKSSYTMISKTVRVKCSKHGWREQDCRNHLAGAKCFVCQRVGPSGEEFLNEALRRHGDKYLYDMETFSKFSLPMRMNCSIHGEFWGKPTSHLRSTACNDCKPRGLPSDVFMSRFRDLYPKKYEVDLSTYKSLRSTLKITCEEHGEFQQKALRLLWGWECKRCDVRGTFPEKVIRGLLSRSEVDFEEQVTFPDLRSRRGYLLRYDFAIPSSRILIEFDGPFHTTPIFWDGLTIEESLARFETGQAHDKLKNEWAASHGWKLYRLSNLDTLKSDVSKIIKRVSK